MGREVKRVALDFVWPLKERWVGYLNPFYKHSHKCPHCEGGYSPFARKIHDMWYGYGGFRPEDNGSTPFTPETPNVRRFAERNVASAPDYYGSGEYAIVREAQRLCNLWNPALCHHLNQEEVEHLFNEGRLREFETCPDARTLNEAYLFGMGHCSTNQWIITKFRCEKAGVDVCCEHCGGDATVWESDEFRKKAEDWVREEPPKGDGWQMWETTSEGSPISPVFATPEELAGWLANTKASSMGSNTATYEQWMGMIVGPGWAMSMVGIPGVGLVSGVEAVSMLDKSA